MKNVHQDIYIGLILIFLAGGLFVKNTSIKGEASLFPLILIILLVLFALFIIKDGYKKTKNIRNGKEEKFEGEEERLNFELLKSPLGTFGIVSLYILLVTFIGFFPATFIFLVSFLIYMGVKGLMKNVYVISGFMLFVYVVFVLQLNVRLPSGLLFD